MSWSIPDGMKEVRVVSTWSHEDVIEVPDDFDTTTDLMTWPEEYLEQVTALGAELIDWDVR